MLEISGRRADDAARLRPVLRVGWALAGMAALSLLPFLIAAHPTMTDLPGHIGRYRVMLDGGRSPWLARYYAFHWRLVGNLGEDLIVRAIGPWLGAERGGWAAAALIPPVTILGLAAVSRALHGRVQPGAVLAAGFVLGNPFLFGFVNYCLALAVALFAFAAWIALVERPVTIRLILLTPLALATWIAHAVGWGVLALLVAGFEGERLWRERTRAAWLRASAMTLAFVPPVLLTLAWRQDGAGALFRYDDHLLARKLMVWVTVLRGGWAPVDIATPLLLGALALWAGRRRAVRVAPGMLAGAALIATAATAMPTTLFGSWGADERIAPAAVMAAALALRSTGRRRADLLLAGAALALFGVRTLDLAWRWRHDDARYESALRGLDRLPVGVRLHAVVLMNGCHAGWRPNGWAHLPDLAIVRRDALVNSQWKLPGAALLTVRYALPPALANDPSQQLSTFGCDGEADLTPLRARVAGLPPGVFQYLWVLDTHGLRNLWPGRRPIYADADSAIYALR